MRLWLDDVRNPVEHTGECDWTWVKTAEEAIRVIGERWEEIEAMSLDHDLHERHYGAGFASSGGYGSAPRPYSVDDYPPPGTGYHVVMFMVETGKWPRNKPRVHSLNDEGRAAMEKKIGEWFGKGAQGG